MIATLLVVADSARARLFDVDWTHPAGRAAAPRLQEWAALVSPEGDMPENEVFRDTNPGRNRGPGGQSFVCDDHRLKHEIDVERRFAKRVVKAVEDRVRSECARSVILAAGSRMLGLLRHESEGLGKRGAEVRTLDCSMAQMSPGEIAEHLLKAGLIPEPRA